MRYIFTLFVLLTLCINALAQSCPATNETFATSALIDPNWTFGCSSGTSCSGGTIFDNRTTCQPTITMDACAPSPSCGTVSNDASGLWFRFYATATTAVVSVNPSVSMRSAVQVFSVNQGSPTCASLAEIGCSVAASVSSGSLVNLSGLTVGNLYFYRVFGSASNAAQRTGTFCFCGSSGLSSSPLAANIRSFAASKQGSNVLISWSTYAGTSAQRFELEKSFDGVRFNKIGSLAANSNSLSDNLYDFTDWPNMQGKYFTG